MVVFVLLVIVGVNLDGTRTAKQERRPGPETVDVSAAEAPQVRDGRDPLGRDGREPLGRDGREPLGRDAS